MPTFEDYLTQAAALSPALPTSPGGHAYATESHPGEALWLVLARTAKDLDDQEIEVAAAIADFETRVTAVEQSVGQDAGAIVRVFTASGVWTKPAGLLYVEVFVCGAGCGASQSGPGGGGAGQSVRLDAASLPATVPVTVGAGSVGNATGTAAANGGSSSFGGFATAAGGLSTTNRVTAGRWAAASNVIASGSTSALSGSGLMWAHVPGWTAPGQPSEGGCNNLTGGGAGGGASCAGGRGGEPGLTGHSAQSAFSTGAAGGTSTTLAADGASRSGSGLGGDGGGGAFAGTLAGNRAGHGGLPGGGGGRGNASGTTCAGGDGARGEVIVTEVYA